MKKVRVLFSDLNGALRGKYVPEEAITKGEAIRMPKSVLSQDIEGEEVGALESYDIATGDRDMQLIPDESTKTEVLGYEDQYYMLADVVVPDGGPIDIAPRYILKQSLKELAKHGLTAKVASEIEFYITQPDGSMLDSDELVRPYGDITALSNLETLFDDIQSSLKSIGLEVEAVLNEAGAGQFEINFKPDEPLAMADKTVYFKQVVRDICRQHGLGVSFLAKPFIFDAGSSQHLHVSLWKDGKNIAITDTATMDSFTAGQVARVHEIFALHAPNPNSYRRLNLSVEHGKWGYVSKVPDWGDDDRNANYRYTGNADNRHLEVRSPGADTNIYLIMASVFFSGLEGVEKKLSLDSDEIKKLSETKFPNSLKLALERFENSDWAKEKFGEDFVQMFLGIKRSELFKFEKQITSWERNTYGKQV